QNLRCPCKCLGKGRCSRAQVDFLQSIELQRLVSLALDRMDRRGNCLEDLSDVEILVGVQQVLPPGFVINSRSRTNQPLWLVLPVKLLLLSVSLLQEDKSCG